MARVAEAWDRSKAPGATSRSTIFERKRTSSTCSAGLPKRRAVDTYPCDALWLGPSWPCMSLDRYSQSTLNVARHAKKSEVEVEGEIESQIEYQEVQEGQASSAAQPIRNQSGRSPSLSTIHSTVLKNGVRFGPLGRARDACD